MSESWDDPEVQRAAAEGRELFKRMVERRRHMDVCAKVINAQKLPNRDCSGLNNYYSLIVCHALLVWRAAAHRWWKQLCAERADHKRTDRLRHMSIAEARIERKRRFAAEALLAQVRSQINTDLAGRIDEYFRDEETP